MITDSKSPKIETFFKAPFYMISSYILSISKPTGIYCEILNITWTCTAILEQIKDKLRELKLRNEQEKRLGIFGGKELFSIRIYRFYPQQNSQNLNNEYILEPGNGFCWKLHYCFSIGFERWQKKERKSFVKMKEVVKYPYTENVH